MRAYAADIQLHIKCCYPCFNAAVQEEFALQAFVRGLQPVRLQEQVGLYVLSIGTEAVVEAQLVKHLLGPKTSSTRPQVR